MINLVQRIEWKKIPPLDDGIKPYYYINNIGEIYSKYSNTYIIPHENHAGYLQVSLMTENGRVFRKLHRLVLICFSPINNYQLYEVNHINGNKHDNSVWNLEWVTSKENKRHAILHGLSTGFIGETNPHNKITEQTAYQIGQLLITKKYTDNEIMKITNCPNKSIIREIATGNTWSYLFNDQELYIMNTTREGRRLTTNQIHIICKYYENNKNKYNGYGSVKAIAIDALNTIKIPVTDTTLRLAKRLYYKYDNKEICNLYNY